MDFLFPFLLISNYKFYALCCRTKSLVFSIKILNYVDMDGRQVDQYKYTCIVKYIHYGIGYLMFPIPIRVLINCNSCKLFLLLWRLYPRWFIKISVCLISWLTSSGTQNLDLLFSFRPIFSMSYPMWHSCLWTRSLFQLCCSMTFALC